MDADNVYQELNAAIDDLTLANLSVSYTRNVSPSGEVDEHLFMVTGSSQSANLLPTLGRLVNEFEPKEVVTDCTTDGAFFGFVFADETIENAPPAPVTSYDSVTPRGEAESDTIHECANCRRRAPTARPPITIRYKTTPYDSCSEEDLYLCVDCSPGHFDDVTRQVEAFGVNDGTVEQIRFPEQSYWDEEADEMQTREAQWIPVEEVTNPYIEDVVRVIENQLLG